MPQSRVISVRFPDDEYKLLQALSLITGRPLNSIVRESVGDYVRAAVDNPELVDMADEAKQRIENANKELRERVLARR